MRLVFAVVFALAGVLWLWVLGCAVFLVEAAEDGIAAEADFVSASVVFAELAGSHLDAILHSRHISELLGRMGVQVEAVDAGLEDGFVVILFVNLSAGFEFVHIGDECLSAAEQVESVYAAFLEWLRGRGFLL